MTLEIWKDVDGYKGIYKVSNLGHVKSVERYTRDGKHLHERILHGGTFSNGYKFVCLRLDDRNKNYSIHRLVAQTFIPNPNNLPCVNHKDGNKQNNNVTNLEWCTQAQNLVHAITIGLVENQCKIRRKVTVRRDEKIVTFETMKDCATFFGFEKGWLQNRIRKHGCIFSYGEYEIQVHERECHSR